ncbi:hypothetical protein [Rhodopirellula bahusiensis]|uniref:hypothetical protein n=1 Tax=Rhodopirellula bahusiensis TaxID=2014065 RepID=UPI0032646EED
MKTWLGLVAILAVTATSATGTEPLPPEGCSRVKLTFALPPNATPTTNQPMTNVGGMVLPVDSVRPISIFVDGKFTGHAMGSPYFPTRPDIHLRAGDHEFEFKCDGFAPVKIKLTVLGNQCTQHLIVKMVEEAEKKTAESRKPAGTAVQVVGSRNAQIENAK